jgi:D-alanine transaminase
MKTLPSLPCYLNGTYTTIDQAHVSVMDRGFIFGDGIYEVVPVYGGRPFRMQHHLSRMRRSLIETRIKNPLSDEALQGIIDRVVGEYAAQQGQAVDASDQMIYIQITRGVALRDHVMPEDITPTVFVMTNAMKMPTPAQRAQGVACVTADDFRWERAHIKSTSLLGAVFARQISYDADALETVMFRGDLLSEAAASNVWVVKDGVVMGPRKDNHVLEGIRYDLIAEICATQNIGYTLKDISRADVMNADELLLSSATKEVLPITQLDGKPVGNGQPGPIYTALYAGYQAAKAAGAVTDPITA